MRNFDLHDFTIDVETENGGSVKTETAAGTDSLRLYIEANGAAPEYIRLNWSFRTEEALVLGDAWERSYGELCFLPIGENDRAMPWYFASSEGEDTYCFGVGTDTNAFVSFRYGKEGLSALVDVRNGTGGVQLGSRRLFVCEFLFRAYHRIRTFRALSDFCGRLCPKPVLPAAPVYGGNNWYYAYGESSRKAILSDARIQAELAEGLSVRPFMVLDDGWQISSCDGPWRPNEKFGDMESLAGEIAAMNVRPGIWFRPLRDSDPSVPEEHRLLRDGKREYLDPTHPAVKEKLASELRRFTDWGYELIKHDFSTCDIFGSWGKDLTDRITEAGSIQFSDRTKTNAEIVRDLYALIRAESGDALLIGCNTVSHLCAGYSELARTGDDTSGREWERTRKMGVNTLAYRLCQNDRFYRADVDCVGILDDNIPWEKNRQWLELLAVSGTALFVSCGRVPDDTVARDLRRAYREFLEPHVLEPVFTAGEKTPAKWICNGKELSFDWQ